VSRYSSLLAKVALRSEGYTLANHFNNSLTVKRIEMMRTIKTNIKRWKLAAVACMLPLIFFFIACQDQVGDDLMEIAQNSTHALIVPEHIQARYEQLKKENPTKKYALLELNETASGRLAELKDQYGLPRHVEVFNGDDEKLVAGSDVLKTLAESKESSYSEFTVTAAESKKAGHTYAIIEFTEQTSKLATASGEDKVFTVVEEQPEFPGGYDSMMVFIRRNLRYPAEARQKGLEGTVYTSFIVEKDGSVTDVKTIRGISPDADAEAARVIQLFPNWNPGKQGGEIVRVRFVMPIKYKLSN
jgi:TonB family protein